jgi:hypothetical protein
MMTQTVTFYPSHLTKGLVASVVALGASVIAVSSGVYAMREFARIGMDEFPDRVALPK